ncbi:MAG TPA: glycosyltransferase [Steroidobacteraceae bacterium]|nr:glycosyltransferase [Steroidobacteraceae bacterium]
MDQSLTTVPPRERNFSAQQIRGNRDPATGGVKICLYSHDTFGLGHLRRNLAIADQLLRCGREFTVWLLTGSPVIRQWNLPPGLRVQPLPPVVKTGAERYASRQPGQLFGLTKGYREALILKLVEEERPDVFLVDHAPAGMNGELLSTLALIRNELPRTRTVLGLRDILDGPATVRRIWQEQEIHALIEHAYDDVFVYGSERMFDVVAGYGMSAALARRVKYCGYVVGRSRMEQLNGRTGGAACWDVRRAGGRPVVLVTAGGGGDGHFLMRAYLEALRENRSNAFHSVIVTGPLMPHEQSAELQEASVGRDDIEIVAYTTDLMPSIRAADLIVSMAGYNTSVELLAARKKAILVPRSAPREEQRLRASLLAGLGLCTCADAGPGLARALATLVPQVLDGPPPDDAHWEAVDLRGAERIVAELSPVVAGSAQVHVRGAA